eukprot:m.228899 g.228899  ORF g.228899 m.228899 type:complete len:327 (+) comp17620_c0_seq1:1343-2323(+)
MSAMEMERELPQPPTDGITATVFAPSDNKLLVSSWDQSLRLYDVSRDQALISQINTPTALLDCAFYDGAHAVCGGLDNAVRWVDLDTATVHTLGNHASGVRCVVARPDGPIVSGSWDKTIRLWDPRTRAATGEHAQADKVYTMALSDNRLVVGMAGRHVWIWDLRNMAGPEQRRESSLKYQTRCIRAFPDKQGYVVTSIEGRVSVELFDPSAEAQRRRYAFKCHRVPAQAGQQEMIYPVNAVAFHPRFGSFATGGCDGFVNVWDGVNKKRICQFRQYPTSVAALAFSHDGALLAVASSYTFEEGEREHAPDALFVRMVNDVEVKPK